uniref:Catechol O-methyltransferase n=1 Tax=Pyrodinium bahamense TaxID=73915 RepID=A0A7S0A5W7_9DINO
MPAGGYYKKAASAEQEEVGIKAVVSEDHDRAAPRGTGAVKAAGNYAADLNPVHAAIKTGYNTTLYLDAKEQRYVEEFSVANFVGVTHDGKYVTPKSSTILESTTNILLMQIAKARGMVVEERPIDFEAEIGNFKEVGMCGTAAVVVKVESITRGDKTYTFDSFDTIASLRSALTSVQHGDAPDEYGFMTEVCNVFDDATDKPACDSPYESAGMLSAVGIVDGLEQPSVPLVRKLFGPKGAGGPTADMATWYSGYERELLDHVVQKATPGNPDSVLRSMDEFWRAKFPRLQEQTAARWEEKRRTISEKTAAMVAKSVVSGRPVRCLELGTYCGYSAILIAKLLPEGSMLHTVESDYLFAAFATKIVEFAGLESKTKIWMGDAGEESALLRARLENEPADLVLFDHSRNQYVEDLQRLEDLGVVTAESAVLFDLGVHLGDATVTQAQHEVIREFFMDRSCVVATML